MNSVKFCTNCGKTIPVSSGFCPYCGSQQSPASANQNQSNSRDNTDFSGYASKTIHSDETQQTYAQNNRTDDAQYNQTYDNSGSQNTYNSEYAYNESSQPGLIESTRISLVDAVKINKRMGRADYWWSVLGQTILAAIFAFVPAFWQSAVGTDGLYSLLALIQTGFDFYIGLVSVTAAIRRLHDCNKSGWFYALNLIPFVGNIIVIVMCCQPSNNYENQWPTAN